MSNKELYLSESLSQIPRILSLMDRNNLSSTEGCLYRVYWHDKATDVPCAHPQIGVYPLAIVYKHKLKNNPFYGRKHILDAAVAGMRFWCKIQKKDGSFDEHYPNEYSLGATVWTMSAITEAYRLLKDELCTEDTSRIEKAMKKAGDWLIHNNEPGNLTNHQALAAFSLLNLYQIFGLKKYQTAADQRIKKVLANQSPEGWYYEYDAADLGYLTTTITFLSKCYRLRKNKSILKSLEKAISFSSHFIYPDGSYGGIVGSRHTAHLHPTGLELMKKELPLAGAILKTNLKGIANGTALLPRYMDDKYFSNLVIEFLEGHLHHKPTKRVPLLPCEQKKFTRVFRDSGLSVYKYPAYYLVVAQKRGAIFKLFDVKKGKLLVSDAGFVGRWKHRLIASQWQNGDFEVEVEEGKVVVSGRFHEISPKTLSTYKLLASRLFLKTVGLNKKVSHKIKGVLIKRLITESKEVPITFKRTIFINRDEIKVQDEVNNRSNTPLSEISLIAEFSPRYVPASRYYQATHAGRTYKKNLNRELKLTRRMKTTDQTTKVEVYK